MASSQSHEDDDGSRGQTNAASQPYQHPGGGTQGPAFWARVPTSFTDYGLMQPVGQALNPKAAIFYPSARRLHAEPLESAVLATVSPAEKEDKNEDQAEQRAARSAPAGVARGGCPSRSDPADAAFAAEACANQQKRPQQKAADPALAAPADAAHADTFPAAVVCEAEGGRASRSSLVAAVPAAAPRPADDVANVFEPGLVGQLVLIEGLVSSPQFNGKWGQVKSFDSVMKRYVVQVFLPDAASAPVLTKLRRETLCLAPGKQQSPHTTLVKPKEDGNEALPAVATACGSGCGSGMHAAAEEVPQFRQHTARLSEVAEYWQDAARRTPPTASRRCSTPAAKKSMKAKVLEKTHETASSSSMAVEKQAEQHSAAEQTPQTSRERLKMALAASKRQGETLAPPTRSILKASPKPCLEEVPEKRQATIQRFQLALAAGVKQALAFAAEGPSSDNDKGPVEWLAERCLVLSLAAR